MSLSLVNPDGDNNEQPIVAEINVTPLTDIFLVLLIIFMVTTSVISTQGKEVDLPASAQASQTPSGVDVTVTSTGEIQIGDQVVAKEALPTVLREALEKSRDKVVVLRGDRKVLLGDAVNILDIAQQAGANGIALATRPPGPDEKK